MARWHGAPRPDAVAAPDPQPLHTRGRTRRRQVPIRFDGWGPLPLQALRTRIDAEFSAAWPHGSPDTLAAHLRAIGRQHQATVLLVLDGFERHLHERAERHDIERFDIELSECIAHEGVPVHVLLVVDELENRALQRYTRWIANFGDDFLRLPSLSPQAADAHSPWHDTDILPPPEGDDDEPMPPHGEGDWPVDVSLDLALPAGEETPPTPQLPEPMPVAAPFAESEPMPWPDEVSLPESALTAAPPPALPVRRCAGACAALCAGAWPRARRCRRPHPCHRHRHQHPHRSAHATPRPTRRPRWNRPHSTSRTSMRAPKPRGLPCAMPGWRATARRPPCRPVAASSRRCSSIRPLCRRHPHCRARRRHRPHRQQRRASRPSVPGRQRSPAPRRHPGRPPSPALRRHPGRAPRRRGSARPTSNRCVACKSAGHAGRGCSAWRSTWWCCWPARGGWRAGSSTASASRRGNGRLPRHRQRPRQPRAGACTDCGAADGRGQARRAGRARASAWHGHPSRAPRRPWSMN